MVGDSANDVDMARAAGIPVIAVDFGYTETPASELNANLVISAFRDLPQAVFGLLGNRVGAQAGTN
jgi:phosphoglycolate phosphatase